MFNKYYQDELSYLREMGQEFARAHPQVAHMLAETGTDPDVERLLEGFAFLTGRVRQRLDSELPELTHALVGLLWPHYLRPIPALSIVQFTGKAALQETQVIPRGTSMESAPVDGVPCRFRTTADVRLYPFVLEGAELRAPLAQPASLRLKFAAAPQVNLAGLDLGPLRLFLHGEPAPVSTLYLWLCRHVRAVTLRAGNQEAHLPDGAITAAGFDDGEALWPYPSDAPGGYRLLQEFFALPERFHFVDVHDLRPLREMAAADRFELVIEFSDPPPDDLRFKPELIRLACAPVVNLMPARSTPIRIDHAKTEYRLRPDVANAAQYEIFSVDSVVGWEQGTVKERGYKPFFSYEHSPPDESKIGDYYQVRLRPATGGAGTDTYIAFAADVIAGAMPPPETIACELTCTNRNLPEKLRPGDISVPTSESPAFAEFRNLTRVTPSVSPPLEDRLLWYLISHWSLNYQTLGKIEALRGILSVYNLPALADRQAQRTHELRLAGLESVQVRPDEILRRGALYRGLDIELEMREDHFAAEGEMFLFASVLNRFFNLYATCNAFTRLRVRGRQKGSVMTWEPILGQQPLL